MGASRASKNILMGMTQNGKKIIKGTVNIVRGTIQNMMNGNKQVNDAYFANPGRLMFNPDGTKRKVPLTK